MRKYIKRKEGVLTLEACLCLTLFMFLILFLYSFFVIFEAQTKIQHTLLQAAQSMSLDAVATENLNGNVSDLYDVAGVIGFNAKNINPEFVSPDVWYERKGQVADVAKERFVAYLTAGDMEKADKLLESYNITGGTTGLDFSGCNIDEEGNINLTVTYSVEYLFDYKAFNMEPLKITNSACSQKWE